MKKTLFIITLTLSVIFLTTPFSKAQDITGEWMGVLKVQGTQLNLMFHIHKSDNGYSATMDSPDQGATGIPVTSTNFDNSMLKISIADAGIDYEGTLKDDHKIIQGTLRQAGQSFPLNLTREKQAKAKLVRPQEPVEPYPYLSENIKFYNTKDNINLAGTLTLPDKTGSFPAVILISGSGPQNRNSEIFGHKPFLLLADELTKNGIAVLRFDDRGIGESEGDFSNATSYDFATDVEAAITYLKSRKEIESKNIGLMGHSEGGLIAPMVSKNSKDVGFMVLLGAPGLRGDKLLLLQKKRIEEKSGIHESAIAQSQKIFAGAYDILLNSKEDIPTLRNEIQKYFNEKFNNALPEKQVIALTEQLTTPWMIDFLKLDPAQSLEKIKVPVLALYGENDLQVPLKENVAIVNLSLKKSGNKNFSVIELENLNHLFQESATGLISEYGQIEQTFSPKALKIIIDWINKVAS